MSERAEYVASLRVERAAQASRPDSATRARRLADIDAELDRYSTEPSAPALEVAAESEPAPANPGLATGRKAAARRSSARKA